MLKSADLLDVRDELHDLAAVLRSLPDLRMFAGVMDDVIAPPGLTDLDRSHDRIGCVVRRLPKDRRAAAGDSLSPDVGLRHAVTEAEVMDLHSAADAIVSAVEFRVRRLAALMAVL